MHKYKKILQAEEERITQALAREVDLLDPVVRPMAEHLLKAGGKRVRPILTVLTGKAFGRSDDALYSLAASIELLHGATLMHDDIVDGADLRRGAPAAHTIFGEQKTVLAGDVLLAASMLGVVRHGNLRVIQSVADASGRTAAGEVDELNNLRNPGLGYEDYMRIITGKTAWLMRCACEIGALSAGAPEEAVAGAAEYGLQLGVAFQLVDDALDIAPEKVTGKPTGGDLREGKWTPPLDFYVRELDAAQREKFLRDFAHGGIKDGNVAAIVENMRRMGCDSKTRELADKHLDKALEALNVLPDGTEKGMLSSLAEYVKKRDR